VPYIVVILCEVLSHVMANEVRASCSVFTILGVAFMGCSSNS